MILKERARAILEQSQALIDNIGAVKGQDYASMVNIMLMSSALRELMHFAVADRDEMLQDAFDKQLHQMMLETVKLLEVPPEALREIVEDAKSVNRTVMSLVHKAAAEEKFG